MILPTYGRKVAFFKGLAVQGCSLARWMPSPPPMVLLEFAPTSQRDVALPLTVSRALESVGVSLAPLQGEGLGDRDVRLETALMALFRDQRDEASYETLYRRSRRMMLAWIVYLLGRRGSGADPVELLQDTFINIYRYAGGFRDEGKNSFRSWARTIAANVVRRSARCRAVSLETMPGGGLEIADGQCAPDQSVMVAEEQDDLKRAWLLLLLHYAQAYQQLSPRDRQAVHLVEVEGLSYSEAGQRLSVGRSNMKMIMFRSRKRLRAHILQAMCTDGERDRLRAVS